MRTGVFGGTFNPVHGGHLHIAGVFADTMHLDRVFWIPTCQPPHKEAGDLASAEDRLEMCRLACGRDPRYTVSDVEIRRQGKSYTADTLRQLSEWFPDDTLCLLMGEDMFLTLLHWYHPERILRLAEICAVPRSQQAQRRMQEQAEKIRLLGGRVRLCAAEYWPVSSTEIRQAVQKGESISGLVPEPVERYILKRGLYGKGKAK